MHDKQEVEETQVLQGDWQATQIFPVAKVWRYCPTLHCKIQLPSLKAKPSMQLRQVVELLHLKHGAMQYTQLLDLLYSWSGHVDTQYSFVEEN